MLNFSCLRHGLSAAEIGLQESHQLHMDQALSLVTGPPHALFTWRRAFPLDADHSFVPRLPFKGAKLCRAPQGGARCPIRNAVFNFSKCSVRAPERAWGKGSPDFVWCCALRAGALCVAAALVVAQDKCWAFHCPSPFRLRVFMRPWKSWWPDNRLFGT